MNELNVNDIAAQANDLVTEDMISPYGMSKIISTIVGEKVQGPVIYSYRNKANGFVCTLVYGKNMVSKDDAVEFITRYASKRLGIK